MLSLTLGFTSKNKGIFTIKSLKDLLFFKNKRVDSVKKNDKLISDEMVECPTCSTFVSSKEAILSSGKFFCSKDCLNNKKA